MYPLMENPPKQTFDGDGIPYMPVTNIMASGHLIVLCLYLCHRVRYGDESPGRKRF